MSHSGDSVVAKLHVFYEIAFGKLYGLELVSISFWAMELAWNWFMDSSGH